MDSSPQKQPAPPRLRPPRALNVVWNPPPEDIGAEVDWSVWYLTDEDDMGEGGEQYLIIRLFLSILTELARRRQWTDVFIGADQFFAWVEHEPLVRVSPDVYLLDFDPPRPLPPSWQTWRAGHRPPRFALEIVSEDWRKDYEQGPPKYAHLGASELVIFDPEHAAGRSRSGQRVALQVFRRECDGGFARVYQGEGPARSEELKAYLVSRVVDAEARLLLSEDARGQELFPTLEQARKAAESEREAERRGRLEAEAKLAELQRRLNELNER